MKPDRRRIRFSGRVQGVGFRMTTLHFATDLSLAGTVQNLPDGDVELIVQGPGHEIDNLVARLHEHFKGFIRNTEINTLPPVGNMESRIQIVP